MAEMNQMQSQSTTVKAEKKMSAETFDHVQINPTPITAGENVGVKGQDMDGVVQKCDVNIEFDSERRN